MNPLGRLVFEMVLGPASLSLLFSIGCSGAARPEADPDTSAPASAAPTLGGVVGMPSVVVAVPSAPASTGTGGAASGGQGGTGSDDAASGGQGGTGSDDAPTYLKASNAEASDLFGVAVAFSVYGNTLAVGANREASVATGFDGNQADNSAVDSGAVYLFSRGAESWQQAAYLKASNTGTGDAFGSSVALSADGTTLVVGAPFEASSATGVDGNQDDDSVVDAGAVYVFVRNGDGWEQEAYLKASNTNERDVFGFAVALSADGDTLAVGANGEDSSATGVDGNANDTSRYEAGAVLVFSRAQGSWQQSAYLKASNTDAGDHFGDSVTLSADGTTLAVGAAFEDGGGVGVDADQSDNAASGVGAAYVFVYDGASWQQQAYLKPGQNDGYGYDTFGISLSLSADGTVLGVGAPGDNSAATGVDGDASDMTKPYSGAAYIFARTGATWQQQAYLKASNTDSADEFGHHVSLSAGATALAVGAAFEASTGVGGVVDQADNSAAEAGAAYVFAYDGTAWGQQAFVKARAPDGGDRFGWAVALSGDATSLAVGASRESSAVIGINGDPSDASAARSGAAYVFDLTPVVE